jgi:hypothetical protein
MKGERPRNNVFMRFGQGWQAGALANALTCHGFRIQSEFFNKL